MTDKDCDIPKGQICENKPLLIPHNPAPIELTTGGSLAFQNDNIFAGVYSKFIFKFPDFYGIVESSRGNLWDTIAGGDGAQFMDYMGASPSNFPQFPAAWIPPVVNGSIIKQNGVLSHWGEVLSKSLFNKFLRINRVDISLPESLIEAIPNAVGNGLFFEYFQGGISGNYSKAMNFIPQTGQQTRNAVPDANLYILSIDTNFLFSLNTAFRIYGISGYGAAGGYNPVSVTLHYDKVITQKYLRI